MCRLCHTGRNIETLVFRCENICAGLVVRLKNVLFIDRYGLCATVFSARLVSQPKSYGQKNAHIWLRYAPSLQRRNRGENIKLRIAT